MFWICRTLTSTADVKSRVYPEPQHTYPMATEELENFERAIEIEDS